LPEIFETIDSSCSLGLIEGMEYFGFWRLWYAYSMCQMPV